MFQSIFESPRFNSSLSLEQLVQKVKSKKDKQVPKFRTSIFIRPRSRSHPELMSCGKSNIGSPTSTNQAAPSPFYVRPHASESGSPSMEQAILMGCNRSLEELDFVYRESMISTSSSEDYNLDELVQALTRKHGALEPPLTPSPPEKFYQRTPLSLFGDELLKSPKTQVRRKLKLCSISEPSSVLVERNSCSTPKQYYMSSFSPCSFSPQKSFLSASPNGSQKFYSLSNSPPPASDSGSLEEKYDPQINKRTSSCTWSGQLPPRKHKNPVFSSKIFLGGVPWDVTEISLIQAFSNFGPIRIEWPGKDTSPSPPKGYVYIVFEQEHNVPLLLSQCTHDQANGGSWYYAISSRRMRSKEVQIIPWVLGDSNFVKCPSQRLDPQKTVFVGALHGMLNAEGLANIFHDLFGGVVYAGIDTDKHKYPIGSGRVTFSSNKSYMKAVAAAFVEIKCQKFSKKVQVDPYLEDALCSSCLLKQGPYFCRDLSCFKYFCRHCWESSHRNEATRNHNPLMRNNRSGGGPATRPIISITSSCTRE